MKKLLILSAILPVALSCGDLIARKTDAPKRLIIVLCDFSTSTNFANTEENLKKNIRDIVFELPASADYYFYPISNGIEKAFIIDATPDDSTQLKRYLKEKYDFVKDTVNNRYAHEKKGNSCIAASLKSCGEQLQFFRQGQHYAKINVVIVSDMLEACTWNKDLVNLEDNVSAKDTIPLHNMKTDDDFSDPALCINIILNSGNVNTLDELKNFWRRFFTKKGYTGDITFPSQVPKGFFR